MNSLELCAGAGGQAQGLERSGFEHEALVEIDAAACKTLRLNRPKWNVIEGDLSEFDARGFRGVDLVAGGVPCPPFSKAGKQLGAEDVRDMFPQAIRVVDETRPQAVMLENVRGLFDPVFADYRQKIAKQLQDLGYWTDWHLFNAADFGVSQLRPRVVFVALRQDVAEHFHWPTPSLKLPPTVGQLLHDLMAANGWQGADAWRQQANNIAPTLVGGSKKHGGPDLGPTRSRTAWATLGVDGRGLVDDAPAADFVGMPRLTVRMCARIQGFPDDWQFVGKKHRVTDKLAMHFRRLLLRQSVRKLLQPLKKQRQQDCSGRPHDDKNCQAANGVQKCTRQAAPPFSGKSWAGDRF